MIAHIAKTMKGGVECVEIERQFLVKVIPPLPEDYELLRQGYVSLEPEIRIRQMGESTFFLTVKRGNGLVRQEWETEITRQEFTNLKERLQPGTLMIEKRRYRIVLGNGLVAEFHLHERHLSGFIYVEVEFPSERAALTFVPPAWFGREVTEDVRFSYGTLARTDGVQIVKKLLEKQ